jgi:hypothetical protein
MLLLYLGNSFTLFICWLKCAQQVMCMEEMKNTHSFVQKPYEKGQKALKIPVHTCSIILK